jgi:hypothetical protein
MQKPIKENYNSEDEWAEALIEYGQKTVIKHRKKINFNVDLEDFEKFQAIASAEKKSISSKLREYIKDEIIFSTEPKLEY